MRIVVTGGAGFIGANFVLHWLRKHPEDEIVVLDALTYAGRLERLESVKDHPTFSFVRGNICDRALCTDVLQGADCVVHFAAESHVDRSLDGLDAEKLFLRTNVEGTLTLLYAALDANVSHFHHVSTDEVYGDLEWDAAELFHEQFPYNPHNPYSVSKAASDFAVGAFARARKLPVTITNCTNNYGPYQTPEKMIPRSIALLLSGKKIQLYTDAEGNPGKNIRDWLHVDDHARAIELVLKKGKPGETYCVGGKCEISNYQLVEHILATMSEIQGTEYSVESHVEFVKDRPGHDRRYAMDTRKIEQTLGFSLSYSFAEGFRKTVEWYLSDAGRAWFAACQDSVDEVRKDQAKSL